MPNFKNNLKPLSFYVFGDSICFGQLVSPHLTWGAKLSSSLNKIKNQKNPVLVQNASVNGNTTRLALERMTYDVTSHNPDFVMIQFGMNDCNYWLTDKGSPRVSKSSFASNLEEIIDRAVINKVKYIILNTNHPSLMGKVNPILNLKHSQSNSDYNEIIRETYLKLKKNKYPISLIDIERLWIEYFYRNKKSSISDYLLEDKVHLSKNGHDLYSKLVVPRIIKNLEVFIS